MEAIQYNQETTAWYRVTWYLILLGGKIPSRAKLLFLCGPQSLISNYETTYCFSLHYIFSSSIVESISSVGPPSFYSRISLRTPWRYYLPSGFPATFLVSRNGPARILRPPYQPFILPDHYCPNRSFWSGYTISLRRL